MTARALDLLVIPHNPLARFVGFGRRERTQRGRHQETENFDRMSHPVDIGDHGEPLPAEEVTETHLRVVPYGARVDAAEIRRGSE